MTASWPTASEAATTVGASAAARAYPPGVTLGERLRRLDDNAASRAVVRASDGVGWWWNVGVGVVMLLAAPVVLVVSGNRDDSFALAAFGAAAAVVGVLLRTGRRRRDAPVPAPVRRTRGATPFRRIGPGQR